MIQYQKSLKADFGDIIQQEAASLKVSTEGNTSDDVSGDDLKKLAEDLPVVRIVDTLLKHAVLQDASDIHIEQMEFEVIAKICNIGDKETEYFNLLVNGQLAYTNESLEKVIDKIKKYLEGKKKL